MRLHLAEHETASVQEHDRAFRPVGDVEPAGHAVGVHVLDPVDGLLELQGGRGQRLGPPRGDVGRPEARILDAGPLRPQLQRCDGLRVQGHASAWGAASRASSSSTTDGSSLVNTGTGFSTFVPGTIGLRSQAGKPE